MCRYLFSFEESFGLPGDSMPNSADGEKTQVDGEIGKIIKLAHIFI
jgi:hypothetical protein